MIRRRSFLKRVGMGAVVAAAGGSTGSAGAPPAYPYHGRTSDYRDWRVIPPGRRISRVETFVQGEIGLVRLTTEDGMSGFGQLSTYNADLTAGILHRNLARQVLGRDASEIDAINDRCIEANHKYPWSYVCRGLAGIDTALWDLYGQVTGKPVCELLGGRPGDVPAYGSSMRRDISPDEEADRLGRLRDSHGFRAFKVRVGRENGHDQDASPGRTEALIPRIRKAVGSDVRLLADGNSGFTPPRAIEVGRLMESHNYVHFEEPYPHWELEWTAEVAAALRMDVAGGEQDNDLAQWRRMIRMNAVDVVQPDLCYVGGVTRAWRVALMAQEARKPVVPHSANLSLVTLFTMHYLCAIPNPGPYVEFSVEWDGGINRAARDVFEPALEVRDGRAVLPSGPGWGVRVKPAWLAAADHLQTEA